MIHFCYKGNNYTIVSWSVDCRLMEIKKTGGKIGRFLKYDDELIVKDFLSWLENINFM